MPEITTDEILKQIALVEKKKKKRTVSVILIVALSGLFFLLYSTYNISKSNKQTQQLTIVKDSLVSENKNFKATINKEDTVKKIIDLFINRKKLSNLQLINLFSDTLIRYYTFTNSTKEKIILEDKLYWNRFPEEYFKPDLSSINISILDSLNVTALIKGVFCRTKNECQDLFQEIRVDKNFNINYVRAYFVDKVKK